MTDKALHARDTKRDIGAELLQSVRDLKAGRWGRKTTIETRADGSVRRRVELPSGKVAKDEILAAQNCAARWALLSARTSSGLSKADFANALGLSKRTLETLAEAVEISADAIVILHERNLLRRKKAAEVPAIRGRKPGRAAA